MKKIVLFNSKNEYIAQVGKECIARTPAAIAQLMGYAYDLNVVFAEMQQRGILRESVVAQIQDVEW